MVCFDFMKKNASRAKKETRRREQKKLSIRRSHAKINEAEKEEVKRKNRESYQKKNSTTSSKDN